MTYKPTTLPVAKLSALSRPKLLATLWRHIWLLLVILLLATVLAIISYEKWLRGYYFMHFGQGQDNVSLVTERNLQLVLTENANLSSRLQLEQEAQKKLAVLLKTAEEEKAYLEKDLLALQSALPLKPAILAMTRLYAETQSDAGKNTLYYRTFLFIPPPRLGMQPAKTAIAISNGRLELEVVGIQNGNRMVLNFPNAQSPPSASGEFVVNMLHYQKLSGVLTLPTGFAAKYLMARITTGNKRVIERSFQF